MIKGTSQVEPSPASSRMPSWTRVLMRFGEQCSRSVAETPDSRLTLALCLPRVNYAAAFFGLGVIKSKYPVTRVETQDQRLQDLVGKWVCLELETATTNVGILEYCKVSQKYKLRIYQKKLPSPDSMSEEKWRKYTPPKSNALWIVLDPQNYGKIQPTGKNFNATKTVSKTQVKKIKAATVSISNLGDLFDCDFRLPLNSGSELIFSIYGNKQRILEEISSSLYAWKETRLAEVLKPKIALSENADFHCDVKSSKEEMTGNDRTIVVIEADRSLPDRLVASRGFNRVVILGRNSASYEESAASLNQEFDIRTRDYGQFHSEVSAIKTLSFYQR
jgi:hypothetical protein